MKTERLFAKTFDSLAEINEFLEEFIAEVGLGLKQAYTLNLAAEEIFTNMVKYGTESSRDVKIKLEQSPVEVTLSLIDFDVAEFDLQSVKKVDSNCPADSITPGGLGLHLIQNMANGFHYDYIDGSAVFTVIIRIAK